ncbi:MAG TPA: hypothetical protein VH639_06555 [Bryobacteraceae bacterium]
MIGVLVDVKTFLGYGVEKAPALAARVDHDAYWGIEMRVAMKDTQWRTIPARVTALFLPEWIIA